MKKPVFGASELNEVVERSLSADFSTMGKPRRKGGVIIGFRRNKLEKGFKFRKVFKQL